MKASERMKSERVVYALLALAVAAYVGYFTLFQFQMSRAFWPGVDQTNMEQTVWNTAHGNFMRSTVYPPTGEIIRDFTDRFTESRLGTHVQPSLLLLVVPYILSPCTETLLVLIGVAVGLGAIPLFRLARRRLGSAWLALAAALVYLLLPAVQTNSAWEIHGASFLPPLMLAALDAAESGKRSWWWAWALLAMGCREDIPFLMGWAMLWLAPVARRREAGVMAALGLGWGLLNFLVIIPHFSGGGGTPYLTRFFPPGTEASMAGMLATLRQPSYWLGQALHFLQYNLYLGLPLLFLYWLRYPAWLALAPMLALNSFTWYEAARLPFYSHYSAPIVAWTVVGAVDGWVALARFLTRFRPALRWQPLLAAALLMACGATGMMQGYLPWDRGFVWPEPLRPAAAMDALLAQIPPDATVSAGIHVAPRLARRETLRFFPDLREATWIAVDVWFWGDPYGAGYEVWEAVLRDPQWETVAAQDGLVILRRGNGPPQGVEAALAPVASGSLPVLQAQFGALDLGVQLQGVRVYPLPFGHFIVCSDWLSVGGRYTPQFQVQAGGGVYPLASVRLAPGFLVRPGVQRDCTQPSAPVDLAGATLGLRVVDAAGVVLPVMIPAPGDWAGRASTVDTMLVLDLAD